MLLALLQAAAAVSAQPQTPAYPSAFSPTFARSLAEERTSKLHTVTVSLDVLNHLTIVARDVCPDPDKERMWEMAMGLTVDERLTINSICMGYIDGAKAALAAVRNDR